MLRPARERAIPQLVDGIRESRRLLSPRVVYILRQVNPLEDARKPGIRAQRIPQRIADNRVLAQSYLVLINGTLDSCEGSILVANTKKGDAERKNFLGV